jgi:DNA-binding MarR family transcriptional regulator
VDNARRLRELWEQLYTSGKIEICTDQLKDLNVIDVKLLKLLTMHPDYTAKSLSHYLNVPASTMTNALRRLEKAGLLTRSIQESDLRSFSLSVTESGKEAITAHREAEQLMFERLLHDFQPEEAEIFVELFEKLVRQSVEDKPL